MKRKTRIISLLLAVITLTALIFTSACTSEKYALKYKSTTASENEYLYWLSGYKYLFLNYYLGGQDTDEAWNYKVSENGTTIEALLSSVALENIKNNVVLLELAKEANIKLSNDDTKSVEDYIASLIEKEGSREKLDSALSAYGVTSSMLKEIYIKQKKIELERQSLFAEGGELTLTDKERDDYFDSEYVRIKHIYINNVKDFARDDEGDLIIDSSTGTYKTRELSDEEKAEKTSLAKSIYADIKAGGDFDALMQANTADTTMNIYPDGYYVTASSTRLPTDLIKKALSMNEGESAYVESEIGIHIIKREPLEARAYADEANSAFFTDFESTLESAKLSNFLSALTPEVEVNDEVIQNFSLRTCTANSSY